MIAEDISACVATYLRPDDLRETLEKVLAGDAIPATILVSEGSSDAGDRRAVEDVLRDLELPPGTRVTLLSPPPDGRRCANRNWIAQHVRTPLVMFVDDDIDVPGAFVSEALTTLAEPEVAIVVAASEEAGGSGWLTHRCHFRPAAPGDPIAVGFQLVVWRTNLFRSLWLDENIVFGSEESDISTRLYERNPRTVCRQATMCFHHRAAAPRDDPAGSGRRDAAERSRCYVAVRRYRASRLSLLAFLAHEVAANVARRRRPLPRGLVPGQWRAVVVYLLGGRRPAFADRPAVAGGPSLRS